LYAVPRGKCSVREAILEDVTCTKQSRVAAGETTGEKASMKAKSVDNNFFMTPPYDVV
jgi:hypothetical protein